MTKIQIDEISYKNFKGVRDFSLTLNGQSAVVSGQNGAGKTTLADGPQWLFFGKDTTGAKLNPKPLDQDNQELLGLNPTIEAQLLIDGKPITLERIQEEKWTTKRGELEATRASDTTKYFVDGVPTKEKDWKKFLEKLGGENLLQMLSNSAFFMSMDWKKRREILIEMSGLTDQEIIDKDPELQELNKILGDHTIDEMKKILDGQKKEIKAKIDGIPARIQENTDTLEKIKASAGERSELEEAIMQAQADLTAAEERFSIVKNGNGSLDAKQELANLKLKYTEAERQFLATAQLGSVSLKEDATRLENNLRLEQGELSQLESKFFQVDQIIRDKEAFRNRKKQEYDELNSRSFEEHATSCPTCGQDLPQDQIERLRAEFNIRKSNDIGINIESVKKAKATKKDLEAARIELKQLEEQIQVKKALVQDLKNQLSAIQAEIQTDMANAGTFKDTKEHTTLMNQMEVVDQKIKQIEVDSSNEANGLKQEVEERRAKLANLQASIQEFRLADDIQTRIDQLKQEDSSLKKQNQEVERQIWLIEEFTRRKVSSIEKSINNKFDLVNWKLFDIQKNGGLAETCEATYQGVEYSSGLNNGSKINCDLDIVNTLSKEFDLFMPVFVDNAESVNELIPIESQIIELQVTEDEKLKVEV